MSTRSAIIMKQGDIYVGIYCHYDGYPEGVGKVLLEHYSDPEKVARLIALGSISSLGERVEPLGEHSFDAPEEGTTVAYHRDRGEEWDESVTPAAGASWKNVSAQIGRNGYVYVFEPEPDEVKARERYEDPTAPRWYVNGMDLEYVLNDDARASDC